MIPPWIMGLDPDGLSPKNKALIISKAPGPALFRAPDLRPANKWQPLQAGEARLPSVSLLIVNVNPLPAVLTEYYMCRAIRHDTAVCMLVTLVAPTVPGWIPPTPGLVQVLTHYFTSFREILFKHAGLITSKCLRALPRG